MLRSMVLAMFAAAALSACGPQGSGPPIPQGDPNALNAPSTQNAAPPEGQANITPEQHAQLQQLVRGYLDNAVERNGQGASAAAGFTDEITSLQPGADHRWQVNLTSGANYRILGACDNECSNLDIELIDAHGAVVASDVRPDDFPVVNFTPASNGAYIVRVMMQACSVAPCYAGARMMTTGAIQPAMSTAKP